MNDNFILYGENDYNGVKGGTLYLYENVKHLFDISFLLNLTKPVFLYQLCRARKFKYVFVWPPGCKFTW